MPVISHIYGVTIDNSIWDVVFSDTTKQSETLVVPGASINQSVNAIAWCDHHDRLYMLNYGTSFFKNWTRTNDTINDIAGIGPGLVSEPNNLTYYSESIYWFTHNSNILNELQLSYNGPADPHLAVARSENHNSWVVRGMDLPTTGTGNNTNSFGDIAIDNNGILYAYTSRGRFYKLDLADPETTFEEISPSLGNDNSKGLQLSFSSDYSILFGHDAIGGQWYTINLSNGNLTTLTGVTSTVGSDGNGFRDLGGISSSN